MKDLHCGYINRNGEFIDCSHYEGPFKHEKLCLFLKTTEEDLMNFLGWVKLTTCLPNKYIFDSPLGLSQSQINWLEENGYQIDELDLEL